MEEEQNITKIPEWRQKHKWDTDKVVPEGWKLGKDPAQGVEDVIIVCSECFLILHDSTY